MALDQFIAALTVAVPIAKAMPMVGQYLEGGFAAVLEICKMAQGTRSLRGECETLAERASYLAVCIALRIDQANIESFPELRENAARFTGVVEKVHQSLAKLLEEKETKSKGRQMLEWTQNKERIRQLSQDLDDGVAGFTLQTRLRSHLILEQLNGTAALLRATSLRLEEGQTALLKGQKELLAAQEQNTRTIVKELASARGTTEAMTGDMDNVILMQLDPELAACYDGAERVPEDALSSIRGSEATCVPGTREQLLRDILDWVNSPQPGLFWLSGLAGTGKTTIALTTAKQLDERGQLLASFFILRDVKRRSRPFFIIATIAYQIAQYDAGIRERVCRVLRDSPDILSKSLDRQVNAFIREPLSSSAFTPAAPCVIVIDALDEYDRERSVGGGDLIPLLVQALPSTVKIILTGRPESAIQGMMSRLGPRIVKLHDMDVDVVQGDIKRYLEYHLAQLAGGEAISPWPSDADLTELSKRCGLLFVYAATIVRYISVTGFTPQERLKAILDSKSALPGGNPYKNLDQDVYAHILEAAVLDGTIVHPTLVDRFQLLVGTIVLAQDPLPISALASFVKLDVSTVRGFLRHLFSVLIIPDLEGSVVRVFHLSFSDFVTDEERCTNKNLYINPSTHHTRLALRCLELMNNSLVRDICGIRDPSLLNDDVHDLQSRLDTHVPPELAYACRHGMSHLQLAEQANPGLISELSKFVEGKLLYWTTTMALLRDIPGALNQLSRAQLFCQGIHALQDEHKLLLVDCERLIREFYDPIKIAALHLYHSALPFAPHCLLVNRTKELQTSVQMISRRHGGWGALLRVIEGHKGGVQSVAFSPSGLQIISGSSDGTVRVWDAQTGVHTKTLEGHTSSVHSVAFSPDGLHIVSGSDDCAVCVWDTQTGENTKTLEGHTKPVYSVAFSPNGLHIISGSDDRTVRIWEMQTGKNKKTLRGHTSWVRSVAFSLDGLHIVSGSDDSMACVWDAQTGELTKTLEGHTSWVRSVAFSPNGLHIATGSYDHTVRVWDAWTGQNTKILQGDFSWVHSVAFSPDGLHLVAGSDAKTLCVWDVQRGTNTKTLEGHTQWVVSVAFSPDGRHVASGSDDCTVRVWDSTQKGNSSRTLEGHTSWVHSVAFSPDGQCIVSGSDDSTVRLWDAQTGENTKTFKGHILAVRSVAFSSDGQSIISGSDDRRVRVWDARKGKNTKTLQGHTQPVLSVAFSPDGLYIVSGSEDFTVRVWDTKTGKNTQTLEGHTDCVVSVVFSPGGLCIVSGSLDHTVHVWDAQTGMNTMTFEGHTAYYIRSVVFLPDGLRIVSASNDETRVWDTRTGKNTRTFNTFTDLPRSVTFSPDGQPIASQHNEASKVNVPFAMPTYTVEESTGWVIYVADLGETPQRRCWLPHDRRPAAPTSIAWHQDILVTGGQSGALTVIRFSA